MIMDMCIANLEMNQFTIKNKLMTDVLIIESNAIKMQYAIEKSDFRKDSIVKFLDYARNHPSER